MEIKEIFIIGGANGSGKTTIAKEYLKEYNDFYFLNADMIASEIVSENPNDNNLLAGKEFFRRMEHSRKTRDKIMIESTLAGGWLNRWLLNFRADGFRINLLYIYLNSTELCLSRIASRVKKGGHDVPKEDVIRRYNRSIRNFWSKYRLQADLWSLIDNSENNYYKIAFGEKDRYMINDIEKFDKIMKEII